MLIRDISTFHIPDYARDPESYRRWLYAECKLAIKNPERKFMRQLAGLTKCWLKTTDPSLAGHIPVLRKASSWANQWLLSH